MQDDLLLNSDAFIGSLCDEFCKHNYIDPTYYDKFDVKRGLRNADGTGVMAGLTQIGNVQGYVVQDGERVPREGRLIYRGINVEDLIDGFVSEKRFGFEETAYLLLFGALPNRSQLEQFTRLIAQCRTLPASFTEDMIIKAPSPDVMNKLARSVLALYSYDPRPEDGSLENLLRQSLELIARVPTIVAHAYAVKRHYYDNQSLYLHRPQEDMSSAENFLYSVRRDNAFTEDEARLLDLCLVLHAEHGGGNNSAFACRVLSSSGTDTYSSIAAAVGSLKGPRHGGANKKVMEMFGCIEETVRDWKDDDEIKACLEEIINGRLGDGSGLIYGMGHAIYTLSDPRAVILKRFARSLAAKKGMSEEFDLFETVERLSPEVFLSVKGETKTMCANIDMYSGLVYKMMNIPMDLYTPLFAIARIVGWCAHRIEEIHNPGNRIMRPAYKAVAPTRPFVPMDRRI
ncbi:citrate/2-methylcitrate synthase [Papillibacter cinnamivorans]|uniref:Citrate synthase n=1 Tax=Papillibacter cinnamivorans DSM 12816 TaxID=1122930 RepID=A0A1W2A5T8_9FIRM|nr:citrate/2-methylcitrate synthase [Papillibacter cinnamivorans]SMC56099.1 citrate synthase [Papillibacter cinnamivorans DSM 12816]